MRFQKTLLALSLSLVLVACSDDDDNDNPPQQTPPETQEPQNPQEPQEPEEPKEQGPITYSFKASGDVQPEYVITQDDIMTGTLSAQGTGIEQLGWNFFYAVGNTLFVTGYENFEAVSYHVDENNEVSQLAAFSFDKPIQVFGNIGDTTFLASDNPADGSDRVRTLYTVDATTGQVTAKTNYTIYDRDTGTPGEGVISWPLSLTVRGEKMFVAFHGLDDAGGFGTPQPDTAYVAIFDYPLADDATPAAIISDERTSMIGVNGVTTALITTDNGDIYSFSNGTLSGGFSPAATKPSGILKIAAGEENFDADYFFNITEATDGGSIFWFDHIGGNKALARIIVNEDDCKAVSEENDNDCSWAAFGRDFFNQKLVIIDLAAQTITDVAGVPLHAKRYSSPIEVLDGKVYVSIETAEDAYVYRVDIEAATAEKGGKIEGKTVKGFYDLHN